MTEVDAEMVAETTGVDPVTITALPALGSLLNNGAALHDTELGEPRAQWVRTRIRSGLLDHVTTRSHR